MEFFQIVFGSEGIQPVLAFAFFTIFGMTLFKLASYSMKKIKGKRSNPPVEIIFDKAKWIDDNSLDFILAFMTSFILFRFFPDIFNWVSTKYPDAPQFTDKMFYGFILGLFFQIIFHYIMNKVTLDKTVAKVSHMVGK